MTVISKVLGAAALIACTAALPSAAMAANATGGGEAIIVTRRKGGCQLERSQSYSILPSTLERMVERRVRGEQTRMALRANLPTT